RDWSPDVCSSDLVAGHLHDRVLQTHLSDDSPSRLRRSGDADGVDVVVGHQCLADCAPSGDDLDSTRRDSGLGEDLRHLQQGQAGELRWFDDDGVASGQTGPDVFHGDHHREVPGRDRRPDTDGTVDREHAAGALGRRNQLTGEAVHVFRRDLEVVARLGDVVDGLGSVGFSLLERQGTSDVLDSVLPQLVDAQAQRCPFECGPVAHLFRGAAGGRDCPVDVGRRGDRNVGDVLTRHWGVELVDLVSRPFGELSVDVQPEIPCHATEDTLGRCLPGMPTDTFLSKTTAPARPATCWLGFPTWDRPTSWMWVVVRATRRGCWWSGGRRRSSWESTRLPRCSRKPGGTFPGQSSSRPTSGTGRPRARSMWSSRTPPSSGWTIIRASWRDWCLGSLLAG